MPLEVKTLPEVPGATVCNAEVPLPSKTALADKVDAPVPPSATVKSVIPVIEPPVIATALAACVAILPSPKFVLAVVVLETSERLLLFSNKPVVDGSAAST